MRGTLRLWVVASKTDTCRSVLPLFFLSFLIAASLSGGEIRVLSRGIGPNVFSLTFDCATDDYYQIMTAGALEPGEWAITNMGLGSLSQVSWTGSTLQVVQYFRIREMSLSIPTRDEDADSMPDVFELQHGLNPLNPFDASQDTDTDGLSNLEEYLLGMNPLKGYITDGDNGALLSVTTPGQ